MLKPRNFCFVHNDTLPYQRRIYKLYNYLNCLLQILSIWNSNTNTICYQANTGYLFDVGLTSNQRCDVDLTSCQRRTEVLCWVTGYKGESCHLRGADIAGLAAQFHAHLWVLAHVISSRNHDLARRFVRASSLGTLTLVVTQVAITALPALSTSQSLSSIA